MALKLCIFFLSALLGSPFILKQKGGAITIGSGNLGFGNQTGSGVVAGQVSAFINYINSASTFYRDDVESKLKYISDQMNTAYGISAGYNYSVYLAYDYDYSWSVYNYYVFASVAPGVDRIFPRHSYMFVLDINNGIRDYVALMDQKGIGIDSNMESVIRNTILAYESYSSCICSTNDTSNIASALKSYDNSPWTVLCSSGYDMSAQVYSYAHKYIYTKPKQCYYLIYAQ